MKLLRLILVLGVMVIIADCNTVDGGDPYSRGDPGAGIQRFAAAELNITAETVSAWEKWRTSDGRILPDTRSVFEYLDNPFDGEPVQPGLIKLSTYYDPASAGRSFGGFGIRAPLPNAVSVDTADTFIEFDLYYPLSAAGKYMRMDIWSTDSGGAGSQEGSGSNDRSSKATLYIRTENLDAIGNLNPDWVAHYNGETWSKKHCIVMSGSKGTWKHINIDINTETGALLDGDLLCIGNIKITKPDPSGIPIPPVLDTEHYRVVRPIREKYNQANGLFMVGSTGTGKVSGLRARHYAIFVNGSNLKALFVHPRAPRWLREETGFNFAGMATGVLDGTAPEYSFPTNEYLQIRDSGKMAEYKSHGHVMAWYNQAPAWMTQIIPENLDMAWNTAGKFYAYGNNAAGPFAAVNKDAARRVYFNHIMYVLRHFMTVDARYGSSAKRGIIPFHSFDVLNEEIHESRHSILIRENPHEWKSGLKSISWLAAMTDNDFDDITQHYIYLLFKYSHIAVPNAQMAARFKAHYDSLPEYMKRDGHDDKGSIDAYISDTPPLLTYNDYGIAVYTKAKMAYNMIKELNTAWLSDPLYDGRPLIEVMGIQGHDMLGPTLASDNQTAIALYAGLIDEGLLSGIAYSELDIKIPDSAPGGGARAPAVLNQKQADALGYQYALLFKVFTKYARYIDHIINWGTAGSGWQNSYVLFNDKQQANQGYYGIMDPDRFIRGHSYLDSFFDGEYEKVR
ncbi:MAG: endo-1,4-beta-xylanase [Treponema sp.]|nr:endo-1,4-beta-xylanase [Treponema sp.]